MTDAAIHSIKARASLKGNGKPEKKSNNNYRCSSKKYHINFCKLLIVGFKHETLETLTPRNLYKLAREKGLKV